MQISGLTVAHIFLFILWGPIVIFPCKNCFFSPLYYVSASQLQRCSVWFTGMGLFVSGGETHILGSVTHNGAVPSMLAVMSSLYYRDDSLHSFFSSSLKRERTLLCPCRVDTVILSALNLARLCWDRGSFLCFTWAQCEKMECLEFSAGADVTVWSSWIWRFSKNAP